MEAEQLVRELGSAQDAAVIGSSGAGPAGDGVAEAVALGLDQDSVVLLIGGGRGITARFATTLASTSRCTLELAGRTRLTDIDDSPGVAVSRTRLELRAAVAASGVQPLAEVERVVDLILNQREVAATVDTLAALGSRVQYRSVEVQDQEAIHRLVKQVYADHGRLDGVIHADPASFGRVFHAQVDAARSLLDAAAELPTVPRFAVLFGSIAGALGNRVQADQPAADDALESIGRRWAARTGNRALTVYWGPWAPNDAHGGMVSPELMRSCRRVGIVLIDNHEDPMSLLRELPWGYPAIDAVVYSASRW